MNVKEVYSVKMKLYNSIIKHDQRSEVLLRMLPDYLYESGWIFNLFLGLSYDKIHKQIIFNNYEWLWKYGMFYKKYVEIPHAASAQEINDYLIKYIKKNYIIGYISNIDEGSMNEEKMILYYDFNAVNNKFSICVFYKDRLLFDGEKSMAEVFDLYYLHDVDSIYRFDVLKPIENLKCKFDIDMLLKDITNKKLFWKNYLFMSKTQIKKSLFVFEDWYALFGLRKKWLQEKYNLGKILHDIEIIINSMKCDRIKILVLVRKYNNICKMIRGCKY